MNLAINALSARQGGGQIYLSNFLRYAKDYPDMKIYCFTTGEFVSLYNYPSVEIILCKKSAKDILGRISWEKTQLPRFLERLQIDLAFCPGGTINFEPPTGCKTAVTFQNMLIFDKDNRSKYPLGMRRMRLALLERLSTKSFRQADLEIFLSNYAKKVIDEKVPDRKGLSVVIPHGLEERFRTVGREGLPRCKLLPDGQYLLYTSVITNFKVQLEVVQAYHILTQKRDTKEKLFLVGPCHRKYEKLVCNEIKQLGLEDKVFIVGQIPHSEMPSVYHYAKAHIFASTCENCPNVIIESLGSGRPIFLSNIQPMPELAGDCAVYFDPYKPSELADLLLRYLDNEIWMKQMGEKAFQRCFLYDWQTTAGKMFELFRNLA